MPTSGLIGERARMSRWYRRQPGEARARPAEHSLAPPRGGGKSTRDADSNRSGGSVPTCEDIIFGAQPLLMSAWRYRRGSWDSGLAAIIWIIAVGPSAGSSSARSIDAVD